MNTGANESRWENAPHTRMGRDRGRGAWGPGQEVPRNHGRLLEKAWTTVISRLRSQCLQAPSGATGLVQRRPTCPEGEEQASVTSGVTHHDRLCTGLGRQPSLGSSPVPQLTWITLSKLLHLYGPRFPVCKNWIIILTSKNHHREEIKQHQVYEAPSTHIPCG